MSNVDVLTWSKVPWSTTLTALDCISMVEVYLCRQLWHRQLFQYLLRPRVKFTCISERFAFRLWITMEKELMARAYILNWCIHIPDYDNCLTRLALASYSTSALCQEVPSAAFLSEVNWIVRCLVSCKLPSLGRSSAMSSLALLWSAPACWQVLLCQAYSSQLGMVGRLLCFKTCSALLWWETFSPSSNPAGLFGKLISLNLSLKCAMNSFYINIAVRIPSS